MKLIKFLVAAVALSLASSVYAAGDVKPMPDSVPFAQYVSGDFDDHWTFTLDTQSKVSYQTGYVAAGTWSDGSAFGIDSLSWLVSLKHSGDNVVVSNGGSGLVSLAAGNYFLDVEGTATGFGVYRVSSFSVTPVPEPGEWALMLSGIGLIGFMIRRRTSA